jgi:hypothetical protein
LSSLLGATLEDVTDKPDENSNALVSRLRVIEEQPLESRAEAYVHLHDALRTRLEGGDAPLDD